MALLLGMLMTSVDGGGEGMVLMLVWLMSDHSSCLTSKTSGMPSGWVARRATHERDISAQEVGGGSVNS